MRIATLHSRPHNMNTFHAIMQVMPVLVMLVLTIFGRLATFRQLARWQQLSAENGVLLRLYWQQPLASVQANRCLYAFLIIPMLIAFALSLVGLFTTDWSISAFNALIWANFICISDQIRGPGYFYISASGIYWSQAILLPYKLSGTSFRWDGIISHRWKSNAAGEYFCFTPNRGDDQFKLETQLGPFTAEQRAKIDAVLDLRAVELAAATENAE